MSASFDQLDAVVCGGGFAGLCAAVTAAEGGARVLLAEKAPHLGGSTLLSGGSVWTWESYEDLRVAIPGGDPLLQKLVVDGVGAGLDWLAGQGVQLSAVKTYQSHGPGRSIGPAQAIAALAERLESLHGMIVTNTALDELLVEDGAVVGARLVESESAVDVRAAAVVLATGGFQGNAELIGRYIVPTPDNLYLRSNEFSTGDAFIAATNVGAAASPGLDGFFGHALAAPPAKFGPEQFGEVTQYYGKFSVALNLSGERFADESEGTGEEVLNQQLARQQGGLGFFVIDEEIAGYSYVEDRVTRVIIERAERFGATVITADTIEELAERLGEHGLPPAGVLKTIREYNEAIAAGRPEDLSPPRRRWHFPILRPPFRAVAVKAGITQTTGGLAVDERMRVLRRSASSSHLDHGIGEGQRPRQRAAIPGLYAAGGDVGNIAHIGYMGNLGAGLVTARIAGTDAAHLAKTTARVAG